MLMHLSHMYLVCVPIPLHIQVNEWSDQCQNATLAEQKQKGNQHNTLQIQDK